jgi:hypothetical protein
VGDEDEKEAKFKKFHLSHNQRTASLQHQNDEEACLVLKKEVKWNTEMFCRRKNCLFEI